jgi:hypothetical protein
VFVGFDFVWGMGYCVGLEIGVMCRFDRWGVSLLEFWLRVRWIYCAISTVLK